MAYKDLHEMFWFPQQPRPRKNASEEETCEIFLVFAPIGNKPVERLFLSSVGSSSSLTPHAFMHWEIRCKWSETKIYTIEAMNQDNLLKPHVIPFTESSKPEYTVECRSPSTLNWLSQAIMDVISIFNGEGDRYCRYTIHLGSFKRSFVQVMQAFDRVSRPSTYDVMDNNCQTWIVDFLSVLDVPVPEELKTIAQQISLTNDGSQLYRAVAKIVAFAYESAKQ